MLNILDMKTCVLVLDNLRSVENTGSIFRTAEGLGVSKIILVGITPTPLDRFGLKRQDFAKVSLGAEDLVEWEYKKEMSEALQELKENNFQIIALEQTESSINIKECQIKDRFALVVGNEVDGVSQEALEVADTAVEIPMFGEKESLNVSVSTGIALHVLI
jgi:23S rRNA (guanosine2251-2'-O)-methyltransferase